MNMQKLMMEAQKMQAKLQKEQVELENSIYEGTSSLVTITMNGKKEVKSVKLNIDEDISTEDVEMLEDMIIGRKIKNNPWLLIYLLQPRVIYFRSWYLTSLVNLSFF